MMTASDYRGFSTESKELRICLICGAKIVYLHVGVDVCRACAIFHKRVTIRKRALVCRTGTAQCTITNNDKKCCKKCRSDRLLSVFAQRKRPLTDRRWHPTVVQRSPIQDITPVIPEYSIPAVPRTRLSHDVIGSVRRGYLLMNDIRRTSELSTRILVSEDHGLVVDGMHVIPLTYGMTNQMTGIMMSSIYEFASTAFPEFKALGYQEQTKLVRNFHSFFKVLDSGYRMHTLLPERMTMAFSSYTTYLDLDTLPEFLSDTPNTKNRTEAERMLQGYLSRDVLLRRLQIKKWNPTEDEFLAFLGISFWTLEKIDVSDEILQIADKYRRKLFAELDMLYRVILHLNEYSNRMGEALVFLASIQSSVIEMRSFLGVLKLLDVFDEKMLIANEKMMFV